MARKVKDPMEDDLPPNRTRCTIALAAVAALVLIALITSIVFGAPDSVLAGLAAALATTLGLLGYVVGHSRS